MYLSISCLLSHNVVVHLPKNTKNTTNTKAKGSFILLMEGILHQMRLVVYPIIYRS